MPAEAHEAKLVIICCQKAKSSQTGVLEALGPASASSQGRWVSPLPGRPPPGPLADHWKTLAPQLIPIFTPPHSFLMLPSSQAVRDLSTPSRLAPSRALRRSGAQSIGPPGPA